MTSPSPEQLKEKIADVQGWTELYFMDTIGFGKSERVLTGAMPKTTNRKSVPDWPGSLDVARELPVKNREKFVAVLGPTAYGAGWKSTASIAQWLTLIAYATAYQWCLAWLLYMGWRWEECGACDDGVVETDHDAGIPDTESKCTHCNGEGGRWEKT